MALSLNFDKFRQNITDGMVETLQEINEDLDEKEIILGVALFTDDGGMTIGMRCATDSYFCSHPELLFSWQEWPLENRSNNVFSELSSATADFILRSSEAISSIRQQILGTLTLAAQDFRERGVVAEEAILLVDVFEPSAPVPYTEERVKRLNSPERYEQYLQLRKEDPE